MTAQQWTCGHFANAMCAECYRRLAQRANQLAEENMQYAVDIERLNAQLDHLQSKLDLSIDTLTRMSKSDA